MHHRLTITVLGSGTSVGVPTIGCACEVCLSSDPRDRRLRPSVLVSWDGHNVLIDTTPDFRQQALRAAIRQLDAVLYTHGHADHILGLDDIRPFNFHRAEPIPVYGSGPTIEHLRRTFSYIFDPHRSESSRPKIETRVFDHRAVELFGIAFEPLPLAHGTGRTYGFRFGSAAYLTDHSEIPAETLERLQGLDVLFLDALRHRPHPTHSTIGKALAHVEQLKPKRAFFTHICHEVMHAAVERELPPHVHLAYDGLEITVETGG